MWFTIVGEICDVEPIALGRSVRVRARLRKLYGGVRWRKLKGIAEVRLPNGTRRVAEVLGTILTESGEKSSRSSVF
jgi:hypothetical protein